jgi:pimeloyl-ACP methyl ester carboxylesterase
MSADVIHPPGTSHDVGGRRLWVEQEGNGDAVMLLSGLGPAGSHVVFHPFFTALAETHRVVYVDLYGRGRSAHPSSLTEITFNGDVTDVAGLIEVLQLGPMHLYGFSYGGLLAQALALHFPHLVRTLTLANTLHSPEMWQLNHVNINRELANQFPEIWSRIEALRRDGVPSTDPRMQQEFTSATRLVRFYNPDNASLLLTEPGSRNVELYPAFCGADVDFIIGGQVPAIPDFRPRLKNLQPPLLVLAGRYDRALYPYLQLEFREFAPTARFKILERSGSFGHVEEPGVVFDTLRKFWQDTSTARPG